LHVSPLDCPEALLWVEADRRVTRDVTASCGLPGSAAGLPVCFRLMQRTMQVFVIPKGPSPGGGPPLPAQPRTVEASNLDGLRDAAHAALTADGLRVRSLSFGPGGLVAYVEQRE
jgi:hypothetical protein